MYNNRSVFRGLFSCDHVKHDGLEHQDERTVRTVNYEYLRAASLESRLKNCELVRRRIASLAKDIVS
jgi:hypothetical protein